MTTRKQGNAVATQAAKALAFKRRLLQPTGNKIKLEKGRFQMPDGQSLEQLRAIILDYRFVNAYYDKPYDPDIQDVAPACLAMSAFPGELQAYPNSPVLQHEGSCKDCPQNQFGSSTNGKGKACSNRMRLAIVTFDAEEGLSDVHTLEVPPTGLKQFNGYLRNLLGVDILPHETVSLIEQDPTKTYSVPAFAKTNHEPFNKAALTAIEAKIQEAQELLDAEPDFSTYTPPQAIKRRAGAKR
jgi:hypothetical protein